MHGNKTIFCRHLVSSIRMNWMAVPGSMEQCARQPMFGSHIITRKPGVWPREYDEPVMHCGDALFINDQFRAACMRTGNTI
jgi:hypothetical protein